MKKTRNANGTAERWINEHIAHRGDECLIWPFSCATPGYGQFMPSGSGKVKMAHRFMCEAAWGPPPSEAHQAAHSCGNRRCVNPSHLSWKTRTENQLDRENHGTKNYWGWKGKLTPRQAIHIRSLKGIETSVRTAARYNTTESNVRLIQSGKTWRALKGV